MARSNSVILSVDEEMQSFCQPIDEYVGKDSRADRQHFSVEGSDRVNSFKKSILQCNKERISTLIQRKKADNRIIEE